MKQIATPAIAALVLALSACSQQAKPAQSVDSMCNSRAYDEIGGPFTLVNQDGETVTEADFAGKPALVFFGFTYCPEICPMTLVTLNRALKAMPEGAEPPVTLMVTVDPERDTPEALKTYIANDAFPESIVGLTGSREQVDAAIEAFKTFGTRVDDPQSAAGYTYDHGTLIYLMSPDWELMTFFDRSTSPEAIAGCIAEKIAS